MRFAAVFFLFCLTAPVCTFAADVKGIEIVEYGIFEIQDDEPRKAEGLPSDKRFEVKSAKLVKQTHSVPAGIGTDFGFTFVVKGAPEGDKVEIVKRIIFPLMKDPSTGREFFRAVWSSSATVGEKEYIGYGFDSEWEMMTGEWIFQVLYGGRTLAERAFFVVKY